MAFQTLRVQSTLYHGIVTVVRGAASRLIAITSRRTAVVLDETTGQVLSTVTGLPAGAHAAVYSGTTLYVLCTGEIVSYTYAADALTRSSTATGYPGTGTTQRTFVRTNWLCRHATAGHLLAPGSEPGSVIMVDATTRREVARLDGVLPNVAFGLVNGNYLYCFDGLGGGAVVAINSTVGRLAKVDEFAAGGCIGWLDGYVSGASLVVGASATSEVVTLSIATATAPTVTTRSEQLDTSHFNDDTFTLAKWVAGDSVRIPESTLLVTGAPAGAGLRIQVTVPPALVVPGFNLSALVGTLGAISGAFAAGSMRLWLKGSLITGFADGAALTAWDDVSQSPLAGAFGTTSPIPTYENSDGYGSAEFTRSGNSTKMSGSVNLLNRMPTKELTLFVVLDSNIPAVGAANNESVFNSSVGAGADRRMVHFTSGGWEFGRTNGVSAETLTVTAPASGKICCIGVINGASSLVNLNGTQVTGTIATPNVSWSQLQLGHYVSGTYGYTGRIYELAVWDGALSTTDIATVRAYATSKFGTP